MPSPQLFSPVTAEGLSLVDSSSSMTVRLSSSMTPSPSRRTSLTTIPEGYRLRSHTDSGTIRTLNLARRGSLRHSMPPPVSPSFSQSASINSFRGSEMRLRSKSGTAIEGPTFMTSPQPAVADKEPSLRWWNFLESVRSWDNTENSVPTEQVSAFTQTREMVFAVIKEVGHVAMPFAEDALDLLELAPIPGLQTVAKGLVGIWNAVKQVEMNRLAFLRLAHSCATILQSIHTEIVEAGVDVERELARPLRELERAFGEIQTLMERQIGVPWLRRYLARQDCLKSIDACNETLLKALDSFKISVQVRILHAITKNPLYNKSENYIQSVVESALHNWQQNKQEENQSPALVGSPHLAGPGTTSPHSNQLPSGTPVDQPVAFLRKIQSSLTAQDAQLDLEDLRHLMQDILQTGSDSDLIRFLQIMRHDMPEAIKALQRSLDSRDSTMSMTTVGGGAGIWTSPSKDLLDREFIETGIGALRQISAGVDTTLPTWTITKFEIQPEKQIGVGNFSQVLKGTWKNRTVAIKLIAKETPSDVFLREMEIWKSLDHPNVLALLGASSATGEPPWFFVSPFMRHGSLVQFLKRVAVQGGEYDGQGLGAIAENMPFSKSRSSLRQVVNRVLKAGDAYGILQDVAKGMEYLHTQHVLHGDLKASNVLLDDRGKCVISDFGQSEMRSEVYRITGKQQHLQGTFRWKAPELMDGIGVLTQATDVYAYGIFCSEVLSMGEIPWPMDDDASVRYLVFVRNKRPTISGDYSSPALHELINACWAREPEQRLPFSTVVQRLQQLRATTATASTTTATGLPPSLRSPDFVEGMGMGVAMSPRLSSHVSSRLSWTPSLLSSEGFDSSEYVSVHGAPGDMIKTMSMDDSVSAASMSMLSMMGAGPEGMGSPISNVNGPIKMPEPVQYFADGTRQTIVLPGLSYHDRSMEEYYHEGVQPAHPSAPLFGAQSTVEARNELRYRVLLEHKYHDSLTLPLWTPTVLSLGDVGYISRPTGEFIRLFNAFKPSSSSDSPYTSSRKGSPWQSGAPSSGPGVPFGMPSVAGYGSVTMRSVKMDRRGVVEKGLDVVVGFFSGSTRRGVGCGGGPAGEVDGHGVNGATHTHAHGDVQVVSPSGAGLCGQTIARRHVVPQPRGTAPLTSTSDSERAHLYAESTEHQYIKDLDATQRWFNANINTITALYGPKHGIGKEDVCLVYGALQAKDYALFVGEGHGGGGEVYFNVFGTQKKGQPWGMFTTTSVGTPAIVNGATEGTRQNGEHHGLGLVNAAAAGAGSRHTSKVSVNGEPKKAVLVARLRFKADQTECTRY